MLSFLKFYFHIALPQKPIQLPWLASLHTNVDRSKTCFTEQKLLISVIINWLECGLIVTNYEHSVNLFN